MGDNSRSLVENLFVPDSQCWLLILVWEVADVTYICCRVRVLWVLCRVPGCVRHGCEAARAHKNAAGVAFVLC